MRYRTHRVFVPLLFILTFVALPTSARVDSSGATLEALERYRTTVDHVRSLDFLYQLKSAILQGRDGSTVKLPSSMARVYGAVDVSYTLKPASQNAGIQPRLLHIDDFSELIIVASPRKKLAVGPSTHGQVVLETTAVNPYHFISQDRAGFLFGYMCWDSARLDEIVSSAREVSTPTPNATTSLLDGSMRPLHTVATLSL